MSSKFRSHYYHISGLVAYASFYAMKKILLSSCVLVLLAGYCHAQAPNICYGAASNTFLPDVKNCSNYFACVNNVGYSQTCPSGYLFDSASQSCNYPSVAQCLTCPTGTTNLTFLAIPSVCDKYVICAGGTAFIQTCSGALEFNPDTNQCDVASNVHCSGPPVTCPSNSTTSNSLVFLPGGSGCTKFTICYNGTPYPQECAANTYFDPTQNACSSSYSCPSSSSTTSARQGAIFTAPVAPFQSYEMKHRKTVSCPATGVKSQPHGSDCSRYITCVNGMSALRSCPDGLHFDIKTETCRIPPLAQCQ